jgi:flagellar motor protein MotB
MMSKGNTLSKHILRASAVLVVAMGASACSTVPDWVDPTTWVGDDSTPTATAPADQGSQTADNNAQTPDLSTIPDRPQTPSTADEQRDVAQSLASDRSKAQYSADSLRGGTEPSAAPPPAEAAPTTEDVASNDNAAAPAPQPAQPAAPPPPPAAGPGTLPADNAASSDNAAAQAAPAPAAAPTQAVAAANVPPPPAAPAVPAVAPAIESGPGMPAVSANTPQYPTTDAALGFRPSSAPPLDATVAQFVPPSILARYAQTAAISAGPAVPIDGGYASTDTASKKHKARRTALGQGGPEKMSGAVVANFDSLQGVEPASAGFPGGPQAVVYFPHDTTVLDAQAKAQVRASAQAFLAQGGQGYVRVIGHSSSEANSMKADRSMVWNFERSQARANAVARLLIQEGVPAGKVLVQAAGSEEAQDGDANRRAEIFFQS